MLICRDFAQFFFYLVHISNIRRVRLFVVVFLSKHLHTCEADGLHLTTILYHFQ